MKLEETIEQKINESNLDKSLITKDFNNWDKLDLKHIKNNFYFSFDKNGTYLFNDLKNYFNQVNSDGLEKAISDNSFLNISNLNFQKKITLFFNQIKNTNKQLKHLKDNDNESLNVFHILFKSGEFYKINKINLEDVPVIKEDFFITYEKEGKQIYKVCDNKKKLENFIIKTFNFYNLNYDIFQLSENTIKAKHEYFSFDLKINQSIESNEKLTIEYMKNIFY